MLNMLGTQGIKAVLKRTPKEKPSDFTLDLRHADELFNGIDSLFAGKRAQGNACNVNLDASNGVYFDVRQETMLPFSFQDTEKGVWASLRHLGTNSSQYAEELNVQLTVQPYFVADEGDILRMSLLSSISGIPDLVGAYTRKTVRRYKDVNRTVFICKMSSTTKSNSGWPAFDDVTFMQIILEKAEPVAGFDGHEDTTAMNSTSVRNEKLQSKRSFGSVAVAS